MVVAAAAPGGLMREEFETFASERLDTDTRG
jgi:hypothetical protein